MKVIVQIPCKNEEETLPLVLKSIPKKIEGIDSIEILILDDASTDKTVEVAKKHGVDHIITRAGWVGLARQFHEGVNYALEHGADIVVNTDGDNQYPQEKIGDLVQPILRGEADIVIADRQTATIAHFSPLKKLLQKFGSFIVNKAAGTDIPDSVSGFRAYSKKSLLRLNIVTRFSYCTETIIQAGNKRLAITSIPIETNPKTRESRLFKNMWHHMYKSGTTIIRAYIMYKPHVVFGTLTAVFLVAGLAPFVRYLILVLQGDAGNHLQSLVLGAVLLMASFVSASLGIIADLIRTNRTLHEDTLERIKETKYGK
jgi:glycosyltransferase involved in cell wall biosynthesis